jgi:hypothetical protein
MIDRQVIEWDKDDIDALKFMKVDVLALGMLTCMKKAFDFLAEHKGVNLDLATIPAEDPRTFRGDFLVELRELEPLTSAVQGCLPAPARPAETSNRGLRR